MSKRILVLVAALIVCAHFISVRGQTSRTSSPDALVRELYRVHNQKHSSFFQTRSRALLYKYFEKKLADMIWKDAVKSKGEVGVIDGDPLYDAQDMEIKHFAIVSPRYEPGRASMHFAFLQAKPFRRRQRHPRCRRALDEGDRAILSIPELRT